MTLRCAVLDDYQDAARRMADWSPIAGQIELTVFTEHLAGEDAVVAALEDFEIVVIMRERTPFPATLFERLPKLRLLITSGMRNAAIDRAAADAAGVMVCGTASASEPPVELTWALILGLARQLPVETIRGTGRWQQTVGTDLYGAQLGLLGLGKIGGRVAQIGLAFGMDVAAWSENLTGDRAAAAGVRHASSLDDLLATSDFVSIHLVLSDRTRGLIGAPELARMRPTAYLINTSRASIVDQAALVQALREGRIAGAGLDVFETEPLPSDDPLRTLPNVLATPHLGYVTERNYRTYFRETVENIAGFLSGAPIRQLV